MDIIRDIIINVILLFGLVFIITIPGAKMDSKKPLINGLMGVFIGVFTIIIILNAWELATGAIFDTRSVMIGATALFFPTVTAVVATLIAIGFRFYLGGVGVYAGILSMGFSLLIGLIWKNHIQQRLKINQFIQFYLLGVLIHIFVVLSQLAFPYPQNLTVIRLVGPYMITIFPVASLLLSIALLNHKKRIEHAQLLSASEKKYRTLIRSAKLGIFHYNTEGVIEVANQAFADILKTSLKQLQGLNMLTLPNQKIVVGVQDSLKGIKTTYEGDYTSLLSGHQFPVRVQFAPIYENYTVIGGIGIAEDLTEEYAQKASIEALKMQDRLTGLYNRVSFDDDLFYPSTESVYPIGVAVFDINAFQIFNTTLGYDVGNDVLISVAHHIKKLTEPYPNIKVYRTGGDEFSFISQGYGYDEIQKMIHEILICEDIHKKYNMEIKLSVGFAMAYDNAESIKKIFSEALDKLQENKVYEGASVSKKTVDIIMSTLFEKSKREKMHSERVSRLSALIAKQIDPNPSFVNRIKLAARLHDIGKINISESILDKPGLLTKEEFSIIKKHSVAGYKILSSVPEYIHIASIVYAHHERYDGKGYPRGLKGNDIPLEARIVSVADAYDAMTELRTYRKVLTHEEAITELENHSGSQFDPEIVEIFIKVMQDHK